MSDPIVPRSLMPQIDEKDIGRLLVFFGNAGIEMSAGEILPVLLTGHQNADELKADKMPIEVLGKPVIVAGNWEIIDGHHRVMAHRQRETLTPYIKFKCSISHALNLLAVFPFAYELDELKPERN